MDKKHHQRRQKGPDKDELADAAAPGADDDAPGGAPDDITPPGASFDTEAGRAAQGMRPDLGGPPDADQPPAEMESAMGGASDGSSGGSSGAAGKGAGSGIPGGGTDMRTDGRFDKGDAEEDRKKIFPDAKANAKRSE